MLSKADPKTCLTWMCAFADRNGFEVRFFETRAEAETEAERELSEGSVALSAYVAQVKTQGDSFARDQALFTGSKTK